jgi:hypothetical protein
MDTTRSPEYQHKIFSNPEDKKLYEGLMFFDVPDLNHPTGFSSTQIFFSDGKVHGNPAIIYPDGLEEQWEKGVFVRVTELPYSSR